MSSPEAPADPGRGDVTRGDVARGAGLAGLARAGALIEAVAQPAYIWMFGLAAYGIYVVLWGVANILANLVDLSTNALQRIVPAESDEQRVHGAIKLALLLSIVPATLIALVVTLEAEAVAGLFSAAAEDAARLPHSIALFVWVLPLWTFVEVTTSAARARRAFGPEIRLRIFWEQAARILFAAGFFLLGFGGIGLMTAHLCSVALTALLCIRLLGRYYDLGRLIRAPIGKPLARLVLVTGFALLPANLARRLLIDAPAVVLNLMLPGAAGASAAGLFEIARKLSTVPHIVRTAFQYVLGPLSAAQASVDRSAIGPLYSFASRVSTALVMPLGGLLIFAGSDILSVYRPEVAAALPLLWVLVAARVVDAMVGPATTIVEMIGHRILPLVNSIGGVLIWALLAFLLTPRLGGLGMAIAVGAGILVQSYAATLELRFSDGLSPFDRKLAQGLAIALAGLAAMALAEYVADGPVRFVLVLTIWGATSWLALRYGLTREDRLALGGLSRRLRLV